MLAKFLRTLLIILVGLLVVVIIQPADFRITRSATIAASPDLVFPLVNEVRKWEGWNPWGKKDPDAKMTYEGPPSGVGASYSWNSRKDDPGEGTNTIIESKPNERVRFRLDFKRPMRATNEAEFTFKPEGGTTLVTWTMSGKNGLVGKAFGLFVNCDKMVGDEFEKGLAGMKTIAEASAGK